MAWIREDLLIVLQVLTGKAAFSAWFFMYQDLLCYYCVSLLHLYGYSVKGHFSIRARLGFGITIDVLYGIT